MEAAFETKCSTKKRNCIILLIVFHCTGRNKYAKFEQISYRNKVRTLSVRRKGKKVF